MKDRNLNQIGWVSMALLALVLPILCIIQDNMIVAGCVIGFVALCSKGFFINNPNEARVVEFFGYYIGTYFKSGIFITIPFARRYVVSMKARSINTDKIKVNDLKGSPIEISVVIMWRVASPAKAYYNVDRYNEFVSVQSDSVIRELAGNYPYDSDSDEESLRKNSEQIACELKSMLENRLSIAGIDVMEAKISHLAYSQEIAQAMLRRQQAHAIASARRFIVQNAMDIVEEVISRFEKDKNMQMDSKQKIQLINNLLISLVSEQDAKPIISLDNC